ncbi:FAD-dependent oxidoreductase [Dactylosporangium salmoneum]|uniref:FAD-dependent oxidoreductase 2 FAD-binding domain-containing protein n=1 Tax=Dactylosporangium salmoneum TaxID=53361 RepID=A0ABN3H880_9ACTN
MVADFDVAIIGSGIAGLSAAVAAAQAGAQVLLAESEARIGGSSRLSTGIMMGAGTRMQRAQGITDSPDALFQDYMTANHWDVEIGAVRRLADECGPAIEWLADGGLEFRPEILFAGGEAVPRGHSPVGEGEAIVRTLTAMAKRTGRVEVALGRRVDRLLTDGRGAVCGIAAGDDELTAAAVILASGGFGANASLLEEHFPSSRLAGDWSWYIGADSARGDGLHLATQVGAHITGHDRGHCGLRTNFGHEVEASYLPGWLLLVLPDGTRCCNEMSPYGMTYQILRARGGRAFAVFDEAAKRAAQPRTSGNAKKVRIPGQSHEDWVEPMIDLMLEAGKVVRRDTLAELADAIAVPVATLQGTVATYNGDLAAGGDRLYRKDPAVLREIATAPFYAVEMRLSMLSLTATGPRIDAGARVLRPTGAPIEGLYAAGEVVGGVLGKTYLGSGNSVSNCLTYGRIAGTEAAAAVTR